MIGNVAKNEKGDLGIITDKQRMYSADAFYVDNWYWYYSGISFDGKYWASSDPEILAENINEYISENTTPKLKLMDLERPIERYQSYGCVSSWTCPDCGHKYVCDSSGKAGTTEGDTTYIHGPCCCGYSIAVGCERC